jgi:RimJ/RimL family protein N-acetyltransferase
MALTAPTSPLSDGVVRLRPVVCGDRNGFEGLVADPAVRRFTRVPQAPRDGFAAEWLDRYIAGWTTGDRAGFAIERQAEVGFAGFACVVNYSAEASEGELGYIVARDARGEGVATRALRLLAGWALGSAGLLRAELIIDVDNAASLAVAEKVRFVLEGVRRGSWVKPGARADVTVWSILAEEAERLLGERYRR